MAEGINIIVLLITIIAVIISLIVPVPIPQEQRLLVVTIIIIVFISIILSNFSRRLEKQEEIQYKIEEKLKIYDRLSKLEAKIDLILKNGKKQ